MEPVALVVAPVVPCELYVGRDVVLGYEEGAPRQHALAHVELGPIHKLEVGGLVAVVHEPHDVAVLLEVDEEHVVARRALELQQLVVEGDDVPRVGELTKLVLS